MKKWFLFTALFKMWLFFRSKDLENNYLCLFESDLLKFEQNHLGSVRCYHKKEACFLECSADNFPSLKVIYDQLNKTEAYYWIIWVANTQPSACSYFNEASPELTQMPMSVSEAMEILSIDELESKSQVKQKYKAAIQKYHPDKGGNAYFAKKIVSARDRLFDEIEN